MFNQKTTHENSGSTSTKTSNAQFFQPRLSVNKPNDVYELEANNVANKIMRKESGATHNNFFTPDVSSIDTTKNPTDRKQNGENSHAEGSSPNGLSNDFSRRLESAKGNGGGLDHSTKTFMESRFSNDFSKVNIHTGGTAMELSESINAKAFTHGNDVFFNSSKFNPESNKDKHLLAHELTHVIQQGGKQSNTVQKADKETTPETAAPVAEPAAPVVSQVVTDLKAKIDDGTITFDSDSKKKELLGENTGTKIKETLQKLVLYLAGLSSIRIAAIVRSSGHHGTGGAVDIGNETIAKDILPGIATDANVTAQGIDELIFDATVAGEKDRNLWNYDQGKKHNYGTETLDDHKDHIHFAVPA